MFADTTRGNKWMTHSRAVHTAIALYSRKHTTKYVPSNFNKWSFRRFVFTPLQQWLCVEQSARTLLELGTRFLGTWNSKFVHITILSCSVQYVCVCVQVPSTGINVAVECALALENCRRTMSSVYIRMSVCPYVRMDCFRSISPFRHACLPFMPRSFDECWAVCQKNTRKTG